MFNNRSLIIILLLTLLLLASANAFASTFKGIVVDSSGKPIAGAKVKFIDFLPSSVANSAPEIVSSTDGSFEYKSVTDKPQGVYGFCLITASGYAWGGGSIPPEKTSTFTLLPPVDVTGVVQDDKGTPLAGIKVAVQGVSVGGTPQPPVYAPQFGMVVSAVTDSTGHYTIKGLPEKSTVQLVFADQPASNPTQVTLPDSPKAMIYHKPASIVGKVLLGDGQPAVNVSVYCNNANGNTITTDDKGSYTIGGVAPGDCTIMANIGNPAQPDNSGGLKDWAGSSPVKVTAIQGQQITAPDIILSKGALFTGTITDADTGKPIADVPINLEFSNPSDQGNIAAYASIPTTDANGAYAFRILPAPVTLRIWNAPDDYISPSYSDAKLVNATEDGVYTTDFKLKKGYPVKLHIVDQNGKVPSQLQFNIDRDPEDNTFGWSISNSPDADGFFEVHSASSGKYKVTLPSLWTLVSGGTFTVPATQPIEITAKQQPPLTITGKVIDPDGNPIPGVKLDFTINTKIDQFNNQNHADNEVSDKFGKFSVANLNPDDTVTVSITKDKYMLISGGAITINKIGATISTPIMTTNDHNLIGVVKDSDGNPVSGAWVISTLGGPDLPVKTDATGHFRMTGLPKSSIDFVAAGNGLVGRSIVEVSGATSYAHIALTDKNTLPTPLDKRRFIDIMESLIPTTANYQYQIWWNNITQDLSPFDPETGLEEVTKQGHVDDWTFFLTCMASCDLDPQLGAKTTKKLISKIVAPDFKAEAALRAGLAILPIDPGHAKYFYDIAKPLIPDKPQFSSTLDDEAQLAALAFGLQLPEADDLTKQAIDTEKKDSQAPGYSDWEQIDLIGNIAVTNPKEAKKLYDSSSSPSKGQQIGTLISPTIGVNPDTAVSTYKLLSGSQTLTYQQNMDIDLVGLDAKHNLTEALTFARSFPKGQGLSNALLQVADNSPVTVAKPIYQEAFDNASTSSSEATQAQVANHAWLRDKEFGLELFSKAKHNLLLLPSGTNSMPAYGITIPPYDDFAWYYAKIDPSYSRVLIEKEYAVDTQGSGAVAKVLSADALVMSALSIDKALGMTHDNPDRHERNETTHRIAMYAAVSAEVRAAMDFTPWANDEVKSPGLQSSRQVW